MEQEPILVRKSLYLEIYTIGYNYEGESILLILRVDGIIKYSCLIDACIQNDDDILYELLSENGISKINCICWTHPHADHTRGMLKLIDQYTDNTTKLCYPPYITGLNLGDKNNEISEIIKLIISEAGRDKRKSTNRPNMEPVSTRCELHYDVFMVDKKPCIFKITALTPALDMCERRFILDNGCEINDFSVSLLVECGGVNIILAGDIEDDAINKVKRHHIPAKVDYLKIPHHGSEGSLDILNWIDQSIAMAVTTEFSKKKLPRETAINRYKLKTNELYVIKRTESEFNYGYTKSVCDILLNLIEHDSKGDVECFKKTN